MPLVSTTLLMLASPVGVAYEIPQEDRVEASYEALAAGDEQAAIDSIDRADALAEQDPARLINLGVALARQGREAAARAMFEAAAASEMRYRLETASGDWVDSRRLALRGLTLLDDGAFADRSRVAQR